MQSRTFSVIASLALLATAAGCTTGGQGRLGAGSAGGAAAAAPDAGGSIVRATCPEIELRTGTAYYRTYARGGAKDKDPDKVVRQAALYDTTRSCTASGDQVNMTVAAAGRIVAGPAGGPGSVTMPIRVAVVGEDGKVIYSQLTQYKAELPSGSATNQFLFKKTVTIPLGAAGSAKAYVGFDEGPSS